MTVSQESSFRLPCATRRGHPIHGVGPAFALGQALEDKDASVRGAATNALKWIDVTAAKKAGVVFE